jgi:hypothetical protein
MRYLVQDTKQGITPKNMLLFGQGELQQAPLNWINLHGEAADVNDDERELLMAEWHTKFWALINKHDIEPSCVYNVDQTGLCYQQLPNSLYVDAKEKTVYTAVPVMIVPIVVSFPVIV